DVRTFCEALRAATEQVVASAPRSLDGGVVAEDTLSQPRLVPSVPIDQSPLLSQKRMVLILGAFAAALAVTFGILMLMPPPNPATTAEAPPEAPPIKLVITFGPPGAVAKLDGVPLAESPFVAQARRDGSMHRVDVEGPGLAPETRLVSYEKDV